MTMPSALCPDPLCIRHRAGDRTRDRHRLLALLLIACLPLAAHAQSSTVSGTVALSSQLVDRGQAVTPQTPVLQGALSWSFAKGWSVGASASVEARKPDRFAETLAQIARSWSLSPDWQMQANLVYYDYPGNPQSRSFDRTEAGVAWIYRDVLTLGVAAIYPVGKTDHHPHGAADIGFHWPLPRHFSLSAGLGVTQTTYSYYAYYRHGHGRYEYDRRDTYSYGHAGLLWNDGPWRMEVDRVATSGLPHRHGYPDTAPWVATVSWSF